MPTSTFLALVTGLAYGVVIGGLIVAKGLGW